MMGQVISGLEETVAFGGVCLVWGANNTYKYATTDSTKKCEAKSYSEKLRNVFSTFRTEEFP